MKNNTFPFTKVQHAHFEFLVVFWFFAWVCHENMCTNCLDSPPQSFVRSTRARADQLQMKNLFFVIKLEYILQKSKQP